ncbi:MAG: InlB B-repeat-containing protein, partial [Firmicutes bacterium]|nr:InlB B-repeat-containing protein [Bacillota bacterium]
MKKFLVFFAFFVVLFTLTACTKNYTVTFETNGGTEITEVTVEKDGSLTLPANPSKTGYAFDGWFKDEALTTKWNAKTDKVTANITLYAKWNEIFTVTFNANGGSSVAALDIVDGGKATKPTDPTKPGFTFDGWYKEAALTNAWNFAQ